MKALIRTTRNPWATGFLGISALLISTIATAQTVQEYPLGIGSDYSGIALGADGNLWFAEYTPSVIGIYKPDGTVLRLSTPTPMSGPEGTILGPDNNIWFMEVKAKKIVRVSYTDHSMGEISAPCTPESDLIRDSTALWFVEECSAGEDITRMTPAGTTSQYPIGTGFSRQIYSLVDGPDGNIWFTEYAGNKIGRLNKSTMTFTEFPIPTADSRPYRIIAGPDGALWFLEAGGKNLARIDTSGNIKEFTWPDSMPESLISGPDGNLWSIDDNKHIWRVIVHSDRIEPQQIRSKEQAINFSAITAGKDGNLWFTEQNGDSLGVIRMDGIFFDDFEGNPTP